jgi:hypothetical protein
MIIPDNVVPKTASSWDEDFRRAWEAKTIYWNTPEAYDNSVLVQRPFENEGFFDMGLTKLKNVKEMIPELATYEGLDSSSDNMWYDGDGWFGYGAPYRKEVYPDGGSYQSDRFRLKDGKIVETDQNYEGQGQFTVNGHDEVHMVADKPDLQTIFPKAADAVEAFYQEIGMMY